MRGQQVTMWIREKKIYNGFKGSVQWVVFHCAEHHKHKSTHLYYFGVDAEISRILEILSSFPPTHFVFNEFSLCIFCHFHAFTLRSKSKFKSVVNHSVGHLKGWVKKLNTFWSVKMHPWHSIHKTNANENGGLCHERWKRLNKEVITERKKLYIV